MHIIFEDLMESTYILRFWFQIIFFMPAAGFFMNQWFGFLNLLALFLFCYAFPLIGYEMDKYSSFMFEQRKRYNEVMFSMNRARGISFLEDSFEGVLFLSYIKADEISRYGGPSQVYGKVYVPISVPIPLSKVRQMKIHFDGNFNTKDQPIDYICVNEVSTFTRGDKK